MTGLQSGSLDDQKFYIEEDQSTAGLERCEQVFQTSNNDKIGVVNAAFFSVIMYDAITESIGGYEHGIRAH